MKINNSQPTLLLLGGLSALIHAAGCAQMPSDTSPQSSMQAPVEHHVVASKPGMFYGWPANNGVWTFDGGREILVGLSQGKFDERSGHNTFGQAEPAEGIDSLLARSVDGGRTWSLEDPAHFVGDGGKPTPLPGGIAFNQPGFALRAEGVGYHGSDAPQGRFFLSKDRGHTWEGPFRFTGLMDDPNLKDMDCTTRTGYLVTGKNSCLIFMSARLNKNGGGRDKTFVAETTDGGKSFHFVSWVVPLSDPHRAVMPAVARLKDGTIVTALRRRIPGDDKTPCWVDAYGSKDNGRTWTFLSRVGETGTGNGNPPALVALKDGHLACAYGDRSRVKLFARLSSDGGRTWDEEIVLRDDFQPDKFGDKDFGYPRLVQNAKGELVALYYWATKALPQQQIAATIWRAKSK
jgi:hypothetical protein